MKLPRPRHPRKNTARGSVLVVCMVLAALGTIGVAAWFSLLDARSHQVEAGFEALERRVALQNGRALARRALYQTRLHANQGLAAETDYAFPSGEGRATIRPYSGVPLRSDTIGSPARNGATPLASHTTDLSVSLHDGTGATPWTFRLRNQNPVLGGDLLTLQAPVQATDGAPLVSGNLRVKGRAVFWDAVVRDLEGGLRADEYLLPGRIAGSTTFSTAAGAATLPLNYPHYLRTTGQTADGPAYRGELELLSQTINPQNSYEARIAAAGPLVLGATLAKTETAGMANRPATPEDPARLTFIASNPPAAVAAELSSHNDLSSQVLVAAVQKSAPALSIQQLHTIFNAQIAPPDDALTVMMAAIDEASLTPALEGQIIDMNVRNGADYNVNGKGAVNLYLDRPGLSRVVVTDVSQLRLIGQPDGTSATSAESLAPLLVLVDNRGGTTLGRIDLFHENHRPFILVIASAPGTPAMPATKFKGGSAFPVWRVVLDLQNTGLAFDLSGVAGATLSGGIRGNHRLSVASGTLTLERDPANASLAPFLSRDAWIESVRN